MTAPADPDRSSETDDAMRLEQLWRDLEKAWLDDDYGN